MDYTIEAVDNKGLGVLAARDFEAGEQVIVDQPYVATVLGGRELHPNLVVCGNCQRLVFVEYSPGAFFDLCDEGCGCKLGCGVMFCSQMCQRQGHICCRESEHHNSLMACPLWKSARFRLYCTAVARSVMTSEDGVDLIQLVDSLIAPPLRKGSDLASLKVKEAFISYCGESVRLLRRAFNITDEMAISELASPAGYELFWRICGANVQSICHPSALEILSSDRRTESDIFQRKFEYIQETVPLDCLCETTHGTGLFSTLCRLNHSCTPNAAFCSVVYSSDPSHTGPAKVAAVALSRIRQGEEVCINYLGDGAGIQQSCEELLERYGFACSCSSTTTSATSTSDGTK